MLIRALTLLPLLSILLEAQPAPDPAALARKALDLVLAGKYPEFHEMSTADVQKGLPLTELAKLGASFKAYGSLEKIGDPQIVQSGPNSIVTFPVKFASHNVNFRIVINSSGLVAGIFQLPGSVDWQRPEYSKPDSFKERDVTVGEGNGSCRHADPAQRQRPFGGGAGARLGPTTGRPSAAPRSSGPRRGPTRGIAVLRYGSEPGVRPRVASIRPYRGRRNGGGRREGCELPHAAGDRWQTVFVIGHTGGYVAPRIAEQDGKLAGW